MSAKPKAARELAAAVLKQITEHPETHDQYTWWGNGFSRVRDAVPTCGSTGCVAGWAVALHYQDKKRVPDPTEHIEDRAARLLHLDEGEGWLFDPYRNHAEVVDALHRIVDGGSVRP